MEWERGGADAGAYMLAGLPVASACTSLAIEVHSASHVGGLANGRIVPDEKSSHPITEAMTDGNWYVNVLAPSPSGVHIVHWLSGFPQWD